MSESPMPVAARLWLAFLCFFRLIADGAFASRVRALREGTPMLGARDEPPPREVAPVEEDEKEVAPRPADDAPALVLLALLQREGRLVDFLEQDIDGFADEEIGAAARVLHAGCRKALRRHATVAPVRSEDEESRVEVREGVDNGAVKLVGQVAGNPPYRGVLRHRGWRVTLSLPEPTAGHDAHVIAPAEVEL